MSKATELVRDRVRAIVTRGFDNYGAYPVESERNYLYVSILDLVISVTDRIENRDQLDVSIYKDSLLRDLFVIGLKQDTLAALLGFVFDSVVEVVREDPSAVQQYLNYKDNLVRLVLSDNSLTEGTARGYLKDISQYSVFDKIIDLGPTNSYLLAGNRPSGLIAPRESKLRAKFSDTFQEKVRQYEDSLSDLIPEINNITSDSKVFELKLPSGEIDQDLLTATFAGEGKKIYSSLLDLYNAVADFGGYEGSLAGSMNYQALYKEYLMAMSYGRTISGGVFFPLFGDFEHVYGDRPSENSITGLAFLESLYRTRSANQSSSPTNPIASKFRSGIRDRSEAPEQILPGLSSLALESAYVECLKVGDSTQALLNRSPEGIGHTRIHFEALSSIFPRSSDLAARSSGLTGALYRLRQSLQQAYYITGGKEPPAYGIPAQLRGISGRVKDLVAILKSTGFVKGGVVPSLSLTMHEPDKSSAAVKLRQIGFNPVEIQQILSVKTFPELLEKFAPLSDSQDVISFFRAFDLTKLLYEFGGQKSIDAYVDFLYGQTNPEDSLIRMLSFLRKSRSAASRISGSQYSTLVGYIVPLTYAVNPAQLAVLDRILVENRLDLFESISYLLNRGVETVLKDPGQINLLSGMVAQMVVQDSSGYENQKRLWNQIIEQSSGNAMAGLTGLYGKTEGITPTELYLSLNSPSATSPAGKILDGVRGGRFTSLIRYCNLFGLLYSLSGFRNSAQTLNRSADQYSQILKLIDNLEGLSRTLDMAANVLSESVPAQTSALPLFVSQNKEFSALLSVVSGSEVDPSGADIAESPGIGNSRVPNQIRLSNSLTPEESRQVAEIGARMGIFSAAEPVEESSYVRVSLSNMLAQGFLPLSAQPREPASDTAAVDAAPVQDYSLVVKPAEGASFTPSTVANSRSGFDPVESCRRFGGRDCDRLGYEPDKLCNKGYSKALFPEEGYGQSSSQVLLDRPLGSKMSAEITYNRVEASSPQFTFSAYGLSELSRSGTLKDSEMLCASLPDLYQYGACMSLLKCRKVELPYAGQYSLGWCPQTLYGGRLKRDN